MNQEYQTFHTDSRVRSWLCGKPDAETIGAITGLLKLPDLQRLAIMPDVHPAADVCVGAVVATSETLYPGVIGGDIGCGMSAVRFEGDASALLPGGAGRKVLDMIAKEAPVMTRAGKDAAWTEDAPEPESLRQKGLAKAASREGLLQLGTLGRGNHFLEVQVEHHVETGEPAIWVMVHSGSRAMGQLIAGQYARLLRDEPAVYRRGRLVGIAADSAIGLDCLADQNWAVAYARANRRRMLAGAAAAMRRVLGLKAEWESLIDLPHNFVRWETHEGLRLLVHRKGAAPALAGQAGIIPGSAGTFSVHVEGRGHEASLCSSSHGAGRVLSRGEARRSISKSKLARQLDGVVFDERTADSLVEEAPGVYRDLRVVLEAQRELVRVTRKLTPLVSYKAG